MEKDFFQKNKEKKQLTSLIGAGPGGQYMHQMHMQSQQQMPPHMYMHFLLFAHAMLLQCLKFF